jgi:hypothetical protein
VNIENKVCAARKFSRPKPFAPEASLEYNRNLLVYPSDIGQHSLDVLKNPGSTGVRESGRGAKYRQIFVVRRLI